TGAVELKWQMHRVARGHPRLSVRPKQDEVTRRNDRVGWKTPLRPIVRIVAEEIAAKVDRPTRRVEQLNPTLELVLCRRLRGGFGLKAGFLMVWLCMLSQSLMDSRASAGSALAVEGASTVPGVALRIAPPEAMASNFSLLVPGGTNRRMLQLVKDVQLMVHGS